MYKKRIAYRLGIYILTSTLVILAAIVFLNFRYSKRMLMQRIEESAINKSELIINQINMHVVAVEGITRNVALQTLYYHQHNDLDFFLRNVLNTNKLLHGIHVDFTPEFSGDKFPNGFSVFCDKDTTQSLSTGNTCLKKFFPDIFTKMEQNPNGLWTDPYWCGRDSSLIISYSYPIRNPKTLEMVGFISGEISMQYINKIVSEIVISKEGNSFLINKEGLFLTHPVDKWVMKRNLFELPPKILPYNKDVLKDQILKGERGSGFTYPEIYNFQKSWCYLAPVGNTNWILIIMIPEKELFHDLHLFFRQIVIVSLIGVILFFVIIMIILNHTLKPLARIAEDIQQFSFGGKKTNEVKNEVVSLVESLEELQTRYAEILQEQNETKKDKRRFEKDMKLAEEIQSNIIPSNYPAFPDRHEIDLYAVHRPAQLIGGDLYDYFFIDEKHLLFTIGDVSGKGIPASLFMALAHTMIKANADVPSSKQIIERINKNLSHRNVNQHFITIFMAVLDVETGQLDYCNAAHFYPYRVTSSGYVEALEQTHGLPVGIYTNKEYTNSTIQLEKGDLIILYTDGVIDCLDENDRPFGQNRLEENLKTIHQETCKDAVQQIEKSLKHFRGNAKQTDDISLLALRLLK